MINSLCPAHRPPDARSSLHAGHLQGSLISYVRSVTTVSSSN